MEKFRLSNGITVLFKKVPSKSVAVEVMVRTGSNYESSDIAGISHFIEHMLFEGTEKRPTSLHITNEIESLGGEFNAYTTGDRTAYYVKVLAKNFDKALDVLSDIISNPLFSEKTIEKEKKVVIKEIHMVMDDPRFYQWVFFEKSILKKHPAKNPTYGNVSSVKGLTRKKIMDYYKKYYIPSKIILSIAGNVESVKDKCEKYFSKMRKAKITALPKFSEPPNEKQETFREKRKTMSAYMILGYKVPPRMHKDTYVLDVIASVLGRGQSGKIFDEVRSKRGLAYEVSVKSETNLDYGLFAVQCSINKEKIETAKNIILGEFRKLKNLKESELEEAKGYIEGSYALHTEDTFKMADELSFWELIQDANLEERYIEKIKKVSREDVARISEKYLNDKFTMAVIEPR